jgi:hypothetical protein
VRAKIVWRGQRSSRAGVSVLSTGERMRQIGFRKWYEGQLLRSHAHLVLLLLAVLALLGGFEAFSREKPWTDQILIAACVLASIAISVLALRRYLFLLNHAEWVADQAVCRQCERYALWELLAEEDAGRRLRVRCRHCNHEWLIGLEA